MVERLCTAANSLNLTVELASPSDWTHGAARGVCVFSEGRPRVKVKQSRNRADVATTLVHEFAHGLLHSDRTDLPERAKREVEAEAVAYLVGRRFNLDMSGSAFYLAAWKGDKPDSVLERLNRIRAVAKSIRDAIRTTFE